MFKKSNRGMSFLLIFLLIASIAFTFAACKGDNNSSVSDVSDNSSSSSIEPAVVGEGETKFLFTVVNPDGNEKVFEVCTDKATVGEALLDAGLISGDDSEYGLYVKTVDGVTLDYDTDKMYWAFYEDGNYANAGVSSTEIKDGVSYAFKAEKA